MRTDSQLLANQYEMPDALREASVLLEFLNPAPRLRAENEFHRIHLTRMQLGAGEEDYYMAEYHQPEKSALDRKCALCQQPTTPLSHDTLICTNRRCVQCQVPVTIAKRGVVKCWVWPGWIVADEEVTYEDGTTVTHELTSHVLLALDRRYSEKVRAGVRRAAESLAEMLLMPLKT